MRSTINIPVAATSSAGISGWHTPALQRDHYCMTTAKMLCKRRPTQKGVAYCSISGAVLIVQYYMKQCNKKVRLACSGKLRTPGALY